MILGESREARKADRHFIERAMCVPILTREEERELAERWHGDGDEEALHRLVRAHVRLVVAQAVKFRHHGLPMGDLVQEGNLGLLQAAAKFEPERDVRFSTYASWWIRATLQDYVLRNWSIVRTGTTASQKSLFFNLRRLRARIQAERDCSPFDTRVEVAAELGVAVAEVENMEARLSGRDRSLNVPLGEDGGVEAVEVIPDDRRGPDRVVAEQNDQPKIERLLEAAVAELSERERTIIRERRLNDEKIPLDALGRRLGLSKERVRQIEHQAIAKLREALGPMKDALI